MLIHNIIYNDWYTPHFRTQITTRLHITYSSNTKWQFMRVEQELAVSTITEKDFYAVIQTTTTTFFKSLWKEPEHGSWIKIIKTATTKL